MFFRVSPVDMGTLGGNKRERNAKQRQFLVFLTVERQWEGKHVAGIVFSNTWLLSLSIWPSYESGRDSNDSQREINPSSSWSASGTQCPFKATWSAYLSAVEESPFQVWRWFYPYLVMHSSIRPPLVTTPRFCWFICQERLLCNCSRTDPVSQVVARILFRKRMEEKEKLSKDSFQM